LTIIVAEVAIMLLHGFGFSAETIDYLLDFGIAEKPLWLIPIRPWILSALVREDESEGSSFMTAPDTS
jgi:hypothetical protein